MGETTSTARSGAPTICRWESWLLFFLSGVYETANQAVQTSRKILELFQNDQRHIETFGRSLATTLRVYKLLQSTP